MSPQGGKGFNCWFQMPFADGARIELVSESEQREIWVYYDIDYDEFDHPEDGLGRFHAQWNRWNPTPRISEDDSTTTSSSSAAPISPATT